MGNGHSQYHLRMEEVFLSLTKVPAEFLFAFFSRSSYVPRVFEEGHRRLDGRHSIGGRDDYFKLRFFIFCVYVALFTQFDTNQPCCPLYMF